MNESQFTFDENACSLKYTLKMAVKTLEMPLKLKSAAMQKQ